MFSGNIDTARLSLDDIERAARHEGTRTARRGSAGSGGLPGRLAMVLVLMALAGVAGYVVA